jgi:hypothetical protein
MPKSVDLLMNRDLYGEADSSFLDGTTATINNTGAFTVDVTQPFICYYKGMLFSSSNYISGDYFKLTIVRDGSEIGTLINRQYVKDAGQVNIFPIPERLASGDTTRFVYTSTDATARTIWLDNEYVR